jgi:hypothetical protein
MKRCVLVPRRTRIVPRITQTRYGPEEVGWWPVAGVFGLAISVITIRYPVIFRRHITVQGLVVIAASARPASRRFCAAALARGPRWELTTGGTPINSWDEHHRHRRLVKNHRLLLRVLPGPASFPGWWRRIRLIVGVFAATLPRTFRTRRSVQVYSPVRPDPGVRDRPRFPLEQEVQREMMSD